MGIRRFPIVDIAEGYDDMSNIVEQDDARPGDARLKVWPLFRRRIAGSAAEAAGP